jgi:hypothetical protein
LQEALAHKRTTQRIDAIHFGFDHHNRSRIAMARTLWFQGYPDQAVEMALQTIEEAKTLDHPVTFCIALIWGVSVFLWTGDLESAEHHINVFIETAARYFLAPYLAVGRGVLGGLAVRRGNAAYGARLVRSALEALHGHHYELVTTDFMISLTLAHITNQEFDSALEAIDETITLVEHGGDLLYMPELLRMKGGILAAMPEPDLAQAEALYASSLAWARRQSAVAWELRTATSLAAHWHAQGQDAQSANLLTPIYQFYTEGFATEDLQNAKRLLDRLKQNTARL